MLDKRLVGQVRYEPYLDKALSKFKLYMNPFSSIFVSIQVKKHHIEQSFLKHQIR